MTAPAVKQLEQAMIDILMITHDRPHYTRLALTRLLETCDETVRVWLWQNGDHKETVELVREMASHPRVGRLHHSRENQMLRGPTNWFWRNADGQLLGKVDDDCLVPHGWIDALRQAHQDVPELGVVSCWPFLKDDFVPELAAGKISRLGKHQVLLNHWVGGSGYLMKRRLFKDLGALGEREAFTGYCLRAAGRGWVNGWYYPFLLMDHMDDPRSPYTRMKTEADFQQMASLSSRRFGTPSLAALRERAIRAAIEVQEASLDLRDHVGWRSRVRRITNRLLKRGRVARFHP